MSDHIAQVPVYRNGTFCKPGDPVSYDGPADWKFMPADPAAQKAWKERHAKPDEADQTNWNWRGRPVSCASETGATLARGTAPASVYNSGQS